mgnify:CR=1 FL=1
MIFFNYETDFKLKDETTIQNWISECIESYGFTEGEINYIFCDDDYLVKLNVEFLKHTDSSGADEYNMTLSKNRANSVTTFMTSKGLDTARFTTKWFGEEQPIADNATPEGRAKNRRVNLAIVPNEKMKEEAKKASGEN